VREEAGPPGPRPRRQGATWPGRGKDGRYPLNEDDDEDEDEEPLLDSLDSELALDALDSELALDALDSVLVLGALDRLEDEESGPVGVPLLQPPSTPTPARAAPPDRRIRNSRRSEKRSFRGLDPFLLSFMTPSLCD
jgi:hypothetical protein